MEEGTVKEFAKRPVKYWAIKYIGKNEAQAEEIARLLVCTGVRLIGGDRLQYPPPPYHEAGYVENGKVRRLWEGDWIMAPTVGDVRVMSDAEFKKEFVDV